MAGGKVKLTEERLSKIEPPSTGEINIRDSESPLTVRVQTNGAAYYVLRYRLPGAASAKRMTIGTVGDIPLKQAREMATAFLIGVRKGSDPSKERAAGVAAGLTLDDLVVAYEAAQRSKGIRNYAGDVRMIRSTFSKLLKKPAASLDRRDYVAVLNDVRKDHADKARRSQALVHSVLEMARNDGRLTVNVMANYRSPTKSKKQKNIEQEEKAGAVLSLSELAVLWRACDDPRTPPVFGLYVQFVIITGVRRGEAALAERSWLHKATDTSPAFVRIPARVAKNGRSHDVFLPPAFMSLLARWLLTHNHRWLFPGTVSRKTKEIASISGWSKRWPRLLDVAESYGLKAEVTLHDIRRSLRTGYEKLGISPLVAERQLNHAQASKLDAIYNRHDYRDERIAAAEQWTAALFAAIDGMPEQSSKVVRLPRKKKA